MSINRQSRRLTWVVGIVLILLILIVAAGVTAWRAQILNLPATDAVTAVTKSDGAISLSTKDYQLQAEAGTFKAGQRVAVKPYNGNLPNFGKGQLLGKPIEVDVPMEPAHPVTVTSAPHQVDAGLVVAALWNSPKQVTSLPVVGLSGHRLRTRVPHFSILSLVLFHSPIDLTPWLVQATESYLKDFFAAPYECSGAGQLQSRLLVGSGIYQGQTILDLGVTDAPPPNTAHLQLCNHREYPMSYRGSGAGELLGLIFPRTTLPLDVPLKGYAGDSFDVFGDFTAEALIWTINLTVLDMLPGSKAISKEVKIAQLQEVVKTAGLSLVTSAVTSCASSIKAALEQLQSAAAITGLLDCYFSLASFQPDITSLFNQLMIHAGLMKAGEAIPGVGNVLLVADLAEPVERLLVETLYFPPKHVAFGYRLSSAFPTNFGPFVGTWKFYGDWMTIQADGTAVYQGRTHVFCDTDPRPPCDGGDRGLAGLNTTIKFTRVQGNTAYGSIVAGTGDRDARGNVLPVGSAISVSVIAKGVLQVSDGLGPFRSCDVYPDSMECVSNT